MAGFGRGNSVELAVSAVAGGAAALTLAATWAKHGRRRQANDQEGLLPRQTDSSSCVGSPASQPSTINSNASRRFGRPKTQPQLPAEYQGSTTIKEYSKEELPTVEALTAELEKHGIDTSTWGTGNTKEVKKYLHEIKENEAGLEIWKTREGVVLPVRVTHVLRAKVTSPDAYSRNVFLFNTWQQYGDGRKRVRNGLLSEKLTTAEMPLTMHLHDVCERAVTEEEMQRVVDCDTRIGKEVGMEAPAWDPDYKCPMTVVHEEFVDHTVEIEASKSYPGLTTAYHLYTVDIICEGLPATDFNTLEFDHPDKDGNRKLKYIHAWVWHEMSTIQRYLFDGSKMKERKSKGSFTTSKELENWLLQFDVDFESWGQGASDKDVAALFSELEGCKCQLERWGRDDGVSLLMRVAHVMQIKVVSSEGSQWFLFEIWSQDSNGKTHDKNRSMARKLSTANLPFSAAHFEEVARTTIESQLTHLCDVHARLDASRLPTPESCERSEVKVHTVEFQGHRFDLENSRSFNGLTTMYHLYTVEVVVDGLPKSDFASLTFPKDGEVHCHGWKWMTWESTLDIMHQHANMTQGGAAACQAKLDKATAACQAAMRRLGPKDRGTGELQQVCSILSEHVQQEAPLYQRIPPKLVSDLADRKGVSDDFLDIALHRERSRSTISIDMRRSRSSQDSTGMPEMLRRVSDHKGPLLPAVQHLGVDEEVVPVSSAADVEIARLKAQLEEAQKEIQALRREALAEALAKK